MDPQSNQPPSHTPQPPAPLPHLPGREALPHIYIDEKKRGIVSWIMIIFLSITVLSIPIGVYLVNKRTNILPQAANEAPQLLESINLETDNNNLSDGAVFPVRVNVRSDAEEANLFAVLLKFPPQNLEVVKVATDSGLITKWVELDFDNLTGTAKLTGAVPNPGLKTSKNQTFTMATLFFRAKGSAKTAVTFASAAIYRNLDNQNILKEKKDLGLNINFSAASTPHPPLIEKPNLNSNISALIQTPSGGEVYSYYKALSISWNPTNISQVTILNLYLNGGLYTSLGKSLENTGRVLWQPSSNLPLQLISSQNIFQLELQGIDKSKRIFSDLSGPFSFSASTNFVEVASSAAVLNESQKSLDFLSKLFSNYNLPQLKNPEVDLNSDATANDLDLFLLRRALYN